MQATDSGMPVNAAIEGRKSIRRFRPDAVSGDTIRDILRVSSRAPSGTNSQPWFVHVVTGGAKDKLSQSVIAAAKAGDKGDEYPYSPSPWWEPYVSRRRKVGFDLYALYGVERHDMEGRMRAGLRNFEFFGAPVGLFFTMERELLYGSWLDVGMFMENVMLMARSHGLETCPQQAWCDYAHVVRRELGISDKHVIVSGMSLGYADQGAKENTLETERVPVDEFAMFHGGV
ncbi:MAG: nitroreductase [Hyphomicrobiaceae bacterium]